jgi:hypothetical protein
MPCNRLSSKGLEFVKTIGTIVALPVAVNDRGVQAALSSSTELLTR